MTFINIFEIPYLKHANDGIQSQHSYCSLARISSKWKTQQSNKKSAGIVEIQK